MLENNLTGINITNDYNQSGLVYQTDTWDYYTYTKPTNDLQFNFYELLGITLIIAIILSLFVESFTKTASYFKKKGTTSVRDIFYGFMHRNLVSRNKNNLRVIKTARNIDAINRGVKKGFTPIIKKVESSDKIKSKFAIYKNKDSGKIVHVGDYRSFRGDYEVLIDFTWYYPYQFESPYAAYLVPKNIKIGEKVFLEDLIEDFIGMRWNQGDTYRLYAAEATWNGKDFNIEYVEKDNIYDVLG